MRRGCRWIIWLSPVVAGIIVGTLGLRGEEGKSKVSKAPTLEDLFAGKLKIIDLTYTLNEKNPHWPGENYEPFKLKTIATLEKDGVLSKAFSMPEHCGTHIDAPNHFEKDQPSVEKIAVNDLFAPGVVIDVSAEAARDSDFELEPPHVEAWERKHGRIPEGAIVMLHTGWSRFWTNVVRYQNQDARGRLHFPGFSAAAAKLLIHERKARGLGIDTLSIDHGLSRDFAVHHVVNAAGRYGLENVANLDKLPARGFYVVVAPLKIETGSGGPTRIFAVLPR
jgi:kynurenine formamidase